MKHMKNENCKSCKQTRENCECHLREDIMKSSGLYKLIKKTSYGKHHTIISKRNL